MAVTNLEYSKEAINCKVAIDNRHKVWLNKTFSPKVLKSQTKKCELMEVFKMLYL